MRRLCDVLLLVDREKLFETYYEREKIKNEASVDKEKLHGFCERQWAYLIKKGKETPVAADRVFCAIPHVDGINGLRAAAELYLTKDIAEAAGNAETMPQPLGWCFENAGSVLGALVAETEYMQYNLYDVLTDILMELSFFGAEQENLEAEKSRLEESLRSVENGDAGRLVGMDELLCSLGIIVENEEASAFLTDRKPKNMSEYQTAHGEDAVTDAMTHALRHSAQALDEYCRMRELRRVAEILPIPE